MADSLQDLKNDLEDEIKGAMADLLDSRDYADQLTEMVDSSVPHSYSSLASCLADDYSLSQVYDTGLLSENPDVWDIIKMAIYEQLQAYAMITFQELKDEFESDKDDLEGEGLELDYIPKSGGKYQIIVTKDNDDEPEDILKGPFGSEYEAVQWWKVNGSTGEA